MIVSVLSCVRGQQSSMGKAVRWSNLLVVVVGWTIAAAGMAWADDDLEQRHHEAERARRAAITGEFVPLAKIMTDLRARQLGEIVETELEADDEDRAYYEFHVLQPDGRVIEIKVDARSGRYLTGEADDD